MQIRLVVIARSSSRRAPATRSFWAPHCAISRPAAAPSVAKPTIETTIRCCLRLPNSPASSASDGPGGERDDRRDAGVVDVGGVEVHQSSGRQPAAVVAGGRRDGVHRLGHRLLAALEDQPRPQRQRDDHRDQRREDDAVADPDLARLGALGKPVVHRPLVHPQAVEGGQRDPDRGDEGEGDLRLEDAVEDVELADEVGRPGDRQVRHRDDQEERGQDRRPHRQAAHPRQVLGPERS